MRYIAIGMMALLWVGCQEQKKQVEVKQSKEVVPPETHAKPTIDIDDPETCAACHANVVAEWKQSMHSQAHHDNDPIFGNMRALRMKKQGDKIANKCVKCHNPRAPEAPDSVAGMAGVSCATCHNIQSVHIEPGVVGVDALEWAQDGMLRAARDRPAGASPVHGTGPKLEVLADGKTVCLACHNATQTPAKQPACTTGPELAQSASEQTCVDCHMPQVDGPVGAFGRQEAHASHKFLGPHRAWYQDDASILEQAVALETRFDQGALVVELTNKSAHAFPSGFPGRFALIKVVGYDKKGAPVWKNFESNPLAEHPESLLNKVYHDKDGEPAPAAFAQELVRDNRLKADEVRVVRYEEVPAKVQRVEVSLVYGLLPAKLAKKLELAAAPEAKPKVIARQTSER